jgi:hypothetical protein
VQSLGKNRQKVQVAFRGEYKLMLDNNLRPGRRFGAWENSQELLSAGIGVEKAAQVH